MGELNDWYGMLGFNFIYMDNNILIWMIWQKAENYPYNA